MFGERFKLARKRAGYSLRELSDAVDGRVSAQALGKYERGEMMPSSDVLLALSRTLEEPISHLMSPMRARLEGVDFRKKSGTSVKDRARVESAVLDHVERYLMVEEILEMDSAPWDRPFAEKRVLSSVDRAESLAEDLRERWNLGDDPIPDMTELLEERGIKVFVLPLPQPVSGLTCLVGRPEHEGHVPAIVVNAIHNVERRRLTLAHELAHGLIDEDSPCDQEKAANRFAGAFLVPEGHLRNEIGERRHAIGYRESVELKHLYRISAAALLVRLEQLGIIRHSTMVHAFRTFARGWRKVEPEAITDQDCERTNRFERLCYRALSEDMISLSKAAELLRMKPSDIRKEVRGPLADEGYSQ